ncbi:MAG: hypothetical protein WDA75_07420 [Candidatus Latescibacterota bacterium]|jgi:hypothetical protein
MGYPAQDVEILRRLAEQVARLAARPINGQRAAMWTRFNGLRPERPMVLIFPEGSWRELLPEEQLQCRDPFCRGLEGELRRRIYHGEILDDDNVIRGDVLSSPVWSMSPWGVEVQRTQPDEATGAHRFVPVLETDQDLDKLQLPQVTVDHVATDQQYQRLTELFDGILPVTRTGVGFTHFAPVDLFSMWVGLERLLWYLVDRPEWVHRGLQRITDGYLGVLDALERENLLRLNNSADYCGSGGVGYTDELPRPDFDGVHVRPRDLWGFATSQIFSEVSPAMHQEFALHYELQWLNRFGLNAYGCCEPLHKKLAEVMQIPRLRRVSMSPWVKVEEGAAQLQNRFIFSYKPNPALVAGVTWEPEVVRRDTRRFLEQTRGCVVEMVLKDTHTCCHQPHRMAEWVRLAQEEAERLA